MEHLLLPAGASIDEDEKARFLAETYDGGPFLKYPERSRFEDLYEVILPPGRYPRSDLTLAAEELAETEILLQTWLVIGLLREVFGDILVESDLVEIRQAGSRKVLTTAKLPGMIDNWVSRDYRNTDSDTKNELLEHLIDCIMLASRMLTAVQRGPGLNKAILWSTASIAETIESVVLETLDKGTRSLPTQWFACYNTEETEAKLRTNGWCPSDIAKWRSSAGGFQNLFYLSKMVQPVRQDHTRCIGNACVAHQYDMSNKIAVHRCRSENCGYFEDGYMGLLDIRNHEDLSKLNIEVVSSKSQRSYVALSHVWADGLGNPAANSLPRCQLSYVAGIVKTLGIACGNPELLLWLDTMCCPVNNLKQRQRCLLLMRQIYEEASHVLILDAQLNNFDATPLKPIEIRTRLIFSGWTGRLWTLQESALAKKLWVQLRDGAVDFDDLLDHIGHLYKTRFIHNPLLLVLVANMKRLRNLTQQTSSLRNLKMSVENRSVTVPSDEALCLCTCLGLEQSAVLSVPDSDRMKAFWLAVGSSQISISKNIIFASGTPRLDSAGIRWAPSSFLWYGEVHHFRNPSSASEVAMIDEDGLAASFAAVECSFFRPSTMADDEHIKAYLKGLETLRYARIAVNDWLLIVLDKVIDVSQDTLTIILDTDLNNLSRDGPTADSRQGVAGTLTNITHSHCVFCPKFSVKGQAHDLTRWVSPNQVDDSFTPETNNKTLQGLPGHIASRPIVSAKSALENDHELYAQMVERSVENPTEAFDTAVDEFAESLIFYLAGHLGEVTRIWSEHQKWLIT